MHFSTFHQYKGVFCQAMKVANTETNFGLGRDFFGALKVLGLKVALIEKVYLIVDPGINWYNRWPSSLPSGMLLGATINCRVVILSANVQ